MHICRAHGQTILLGRPGLEWGVGWWEEKQDGGINMGEGRGPLQYFEQYSLKIKMGWGLVEPGFKWMNEVNAF